MRGTSAQLLQIQELLYRYGWDDWDAPDSEEEMLREREPSPQPKCHLTEFEFSPPQFHPDLCIGLSLVDCCCLPQQLLLRHLLSRLALAGLLNTMLAASAAAGLLITAAAAAVLHRRPPGDARSV